MSVFKSNASNLTLVMASGRLCILLSSCLILIKWSTSFVECFLCQEVLSDGAQYKHAVSFTVCILQERKKRLYIWDFFFFSLFCMSYSLDSRQVNKNTLYAAKEPQTCFWLEIKSKAQNMNGAFSCFFFF